MTIEEIIDTIAAALLFLSFPLIMSGGFALTHVSEETTETAIAAAEASLLLGFASFFTGFILVLSFAVIPRRWLRKEVKRPSISVEWI